MKPACAALAVLAFACDKPAKPATRDTRDTPPAPPVATIVDAQRSASPIPASSRQLILGIVDEWTSTRATLRLFTRDDNWKPIGDSWPAVIGSQGAAFGRGLHGQAAVKQEGDDKAPAGIFTLRGSYGYAAAPPAGTKLPYTRSDTLECVDDPASAHYTQILDGSVATRDWKSSERMRHAGRFYTWVIDIAHNEAATPRGGSCIFFHVWGGPDSTTNGCTAMAEDKLVELMQRLDPAAEPVYVLLPRREYEALREPWKLPAL